MSRQPAAQRMPAIRAICFDLDNTLWDVWPVIRRAEQAMYDFLKERYPRVVAKLTLETLRTAREEVAARFPHMKHDFTFLRKQSLREHAAEFGYAEDMVEEAFDVFFRSANVTGCSRPAMAMPILRASASRTGSSAPWRRVMSVRSSRTR
jgi:FMN phosphatase YigB (HAD superfamily)